MKNKGKVHEEDLEIFKDTIAICNHFRRKFKNSNDENNYEWNHFQKFTRVMNDLFNGSKMKDKDKSIKKERIQF